MKGNLHQEKESRVPPGGLCEWAGLLATMAGWVLGHPHPRPVWPSWQSQGGGRCQEAVVSWLRKNTCRP